MANMDEADLDAGKPVDGFEATDSEENLLNAVQEKAILESKKAQQIVCPHCNGHVDLPKPDFVASVIGGFGSGLGGIMGATIAQNVATLEKAKRMVLAAGYEIAKKKRTRKTPETIK